VYAGIVAMPRGAVADATVATIVASGFSPLSSAFSLVMKRIALAPALMGGALPAVTVGLP